MRTYIGIWCVHLLKISNNLALRVSYKQLLAIDRIMHNLQKHTHKTFVSDTKSLPESMDIA